jgi:hypothetical protein
MNSPRRELNLRDQVHEFDDFAKFKQPRALVPYRERLARTFGHELAGSQAVSSCTLPNPNPQHHQHRWWHIQDDRPTDGRLWNRQKSMHHGVVPVGLIRKRLSLR